ncbi:unnamed protein product [Allacma fusca]|uniref:Uncharacterized protein n=1 Tax=Allacma fusca TaxID=39272 RepID=A0A8J2PCN0_9HEXA|nr:unnamed protein product [Allacma fusca]
MKVFTVHFLFILLIAIAVGYWSKSCSAQEPGVKRGRNETYESMERKKHLKTHCVIYNGNCMAKKDCKQFNNIKWNTECDSHKKVCCTESLKFKMKNRASQFREPT